MSEAMFVPPPSLDGYSVAKNGTMPVTTYVDAWHWRCWKCGANGRDHFSPEMAEKEALRHLTQQCEARNEESA